MYIELATVAWMLGSYVYHRWIEHHDAPEPERKPFEIPVTEEGAPVPLIYGRVRVRQPVFAWSGLPLFADSVYQLNTFWALGIPFDSGNGTNRVHGMWQGEAKFEWQLSTDPTNPFATQTGDGEFEAVIFAEIDDFDGVRVGGFVETLNGKPTQRLVDGDGAATTNTGFLMLDGGFTADQIPGYRPMVCVLLFADSAHDAFIVGTATTVPSYSFEVSSYHTNHAQLGTFCRVGDDSNPINVLYDLLVSQFAKAGLPTSLIDVSSFQAAQYTLHTETHGYSRCFDQRQPVSDCIMEILRQIDAALFEDPITGQIKIKLVRADYDPLTIPHITKYNCKKITNFASGGWSNLINRVRVTYTSRERDYTNDSETISNMANAAGQDGQVIEEVINYPGCTRANQAASLAGRELAARSRPIIKMRAIVDRSFLRVTPGDAVKVTYTNPDIAGLIFRVANVERGTLEDGAIALDLIQDFAYTWRGAAPEPGDYGLDLTGGGVREVRP